VNVTIIGTGNMARGVGSRVLAGRNHLTVLGKRQEDATAVASDLQGEAGGAEIRTGVSSDPIVDDLVVLAVYYPDARAFVEERSDALAGKTVVDITVPVNETYDALITPPDGSATRELSKLAPGTKFVKAFSTTFANTLRDGVVDGRPLDVLIAGDDEGAKADVAELARAGGLRPIDAGSVERARELEAASLLHITLQNTLGSGFRSALKLLP
jgi:NADPH-dependent F420 reductase